MTTHAKLRSIFKLSIDELEMIVASNLLPEGVTLEGIEERRDFDKLFKHRLNPKFIAEACLKEKKKEEMAAASASPREPSELKSQRMELKARELEVRKLKLEGQTIVNNRIIQKLQGLESAQHLIISGIAKINERLELIQSLITQEAKPPQEGE